MAIKAPNGRPYPRLVLGETISVAVETFRAHKTRFMLTGLGMVIGTASLILVVTIGLTGKEYILRQIQAIGANMMVAYYQGGSAYGSSSSDYLTLEDMDAVRRQVPGITSSSPMLELHDRIAIPGGKERDVLILGVASQYQSVRNLEVVAGRFFDDNDVRARSKVADITVNLAIKLFGSPDAAVGQEIRLQGLPFFIVGVFKERVDTFGQSEISEETILIPHTVARFFMSTDEVKQLFFSVADSREVPRATEQILRVLHSRHRPESVYKVDNLTQLLSVASKTANALTTVLLLISVLTLLVSGVGIMNIMLATVTSRIREIGVRKAVGATRHEIRAQFLAEAMMISLGGGTIGIITGLALPFSLRFLTDYRLPVSGWSVIIAVLVSSIVGILFGTVPAARAARLDPVESLRYE
ncbi:MAG: ABC transporter permease [Candidatus Korobacteraceae bacterium]